MLLFKFCNDVVRFQDWFLRRKRFVPKKSASSKGEKAVIAALERHSMQYEMQYELGYYVHADFAVHYNENLYIIEYNGRQHYHAVKYFGGYWKFFLQRMRDTLERWECKDRGIPLLSIRYDVPLEDIEDMVIGFITNEKC